MKIVDNYFNYKRQYPKYVILITLGTFVEIYGEDTNIMNRLFNYKITTYGNTKRLGFPVSSLLKVGLELTNNKINYIIVDRDKLMEKKRFNPNNYDNYRENSNYKNIDKRIEKITSKLKSSINEYDINELLIDIENRLYER